MTIEARFMNHDGEGHRMVLLFNPGRLNVTVFHAPTLGNERVRLHKVAGGREVDLSPSRWRGLAVLIEKRARLFKRCHKRYSPALAKQVAAACRRRAG